MLTAGFWVISFVAVAFVLVPSARVFLYSWHQGGYRRFFSVIGLIFISVLGIASLNDPNYKTFEESAVVFYAIWGSLFYFLIMLVLCARLTISGIRKLRRPKVF